MVAVTLLHRKGYFYQRLDSAGRQIEEPVDWAVDDFLTELPQRVSVTIEGRAVALRAWKYASPAPADFRCRSIFSTPICRRIPTWDRTLTDYLYGGDRALPALPGSHPRHRRGAHAARLGQTRSTATT